MSEELYKKAFGSCDFDAKQEKSLEVKWSGYGLEGIMEGFKEWFAPILIEESKFQLRVEEYDAHYSHAWHAVKGISYKKEDISLFCESPDVPWVRGIAGLYASALVNSIIADGDTIAIKPMHFSWSHLGYRHSKGELIIDGYAGWNLGWKMSGGKIIVKGFMNRDGMDVNNVPVPDCNAVGMTGGEIWHCGKKVYPS